MLRLQTAPLPETIEETTVTTGNHLGGRVIVYNCDCHSYDQVIDLLCRAVPKMTPVRAFESIGPQNGQALSKLIPELYSEITASSALGPNAIFASIAASTSGFSIVT